MHPVYQYQYLTYLQRSRRAVTMSQKNSLHVDYYRKKSTETTTNGIGMISEANQAERDLNNQLILLATVFIATAGAILAGGIFADSYTLGQTIATLMVVSLAILAIVFGVLNYLSTIKFFVKSSRDYANLSHKFDEAELAALGGDVGAHELIVAEIKELSEEFGKDSGPVFIRLEILFLAVSGFSLLALVSAIVLNWGDIFNAIGSLFL